MQYDDGWTKEKKRRGRRSKEKKVAARANFFQRTAVKQNLRVQDLYHASAKEQLGRQAHE